MHEKIWFLTAERAVLITCRVISVFIISYHLGTEGQGIYSILIVTMGTTSIIGLLGYDVSNNYYGAKIVDQDDMSRLMGGLLIVSTVTSIMVSVLLVALYFLTDLFVSIEYSILSILLVGSALTIFGNNAGRFLFGLKNVRAHFYGSVFQQIGFLVLLVINMFYFQLTPAVAGWTWIVGLCIQVLYWYLALFRCSNWRFIFHAKTIFRNYRYGLGVFPYYALNAISFRINNYVLLYMLGPSSVGIYSIGLTLLEVILYIPRTFASLIIAEVSKTNKFPAFVMRSIVSIMIIVVFVVAVVTPFVLPIILPAFADSVGVVEILLPGTLLLGFVVLVSHYMFGKEQRIMPSITTAFGLIITLVFDLLLIPHLGIYGASLASSLAYSGMFIIIVLSFRELRSSQLASCFIPTLRFYMIFTKNEK